MIVSYNFPPEVGGNSSRQVSPADVRNFYLEKDASTGRVVWKDLPGLKNIATGAGSDRGQHVMADVRYVINGTTLYSESAFGSRTSLGTISGGDRAVMADDGTNLLIVANNTLYKYNGVNVSTISQSVVTNPAWVAFLNNTFVIGGDNQRFATSDAGDPDTWNALNFATADVDSDELVRGFVHKGRLYLLGSESCEIWVYTGSGNPPMQRSGASQIANTGIIGKYAISESDNFFYWVGDDKKVYQGYGGSAKVVSTIGVSTIIEGYSIVSDCIVSSFVLRGQTFVLFKFPGAGDALLYSESLNYWVTLSSGTDRDSREAWLANEVQFVYGKNIATDSASGHSYELDFETYTDNGENRLRMIVGNPITGALINVPQNMVTVSNINVPMQTGVGLATGQGSSPTLQYQFSNDGGHTFGTQHSVSIGASGEYVKKVMLYDFSTGYEVVPRLMISDPVPCTFYMGSQNATGTANVMDAGY